MKEEKKQIKANTPNKHKIVLLGDQSVGKTSLLHRFLYDTYQEDNSVF